MKSRIWSCAALAILLAAALAMASSRPRALYRIELRGGGEVLANDRPYHRGSVILFHRHSNGSLTSLPEEEVVGVVANVIDVKAQGLQPGDVVYIGPTGPGTPSTAPAAVATSPPPMLPGGVYDPRNPVYGYSAPANGGNQFGLSSGVFSPVTPGDLARAISAAPPNGENPVGPNGFPTTAAGVAPPVGPDGQLILAPPGSSGSTPLTIGPNGIPVLAPAGSPGSAAPPVGANGTPVFAPSGSPGSAAPSVGPNGTPVMAPSGSPGSASPPIGPNGTPVLAPSGSPGSTSPPVGPNGYPAPGAARR